MKEFKKVCNLVNKGFLFVTLGGTEYSLTPKSLFS